MDVVQMKALRSGIASVSTTLVVCILILVALNWVSEAYLRANPDILLTRDQRVHENTRSVRENMIPRDKITEWYDLESADDLHPMWEEFYTAGVEFESYVHYRASPKEGQFYGVTGPGYRRVKNQGPWPLSNENYNVFFFGGSTSFGVGPYWGTVASYLQEAMNAGGVRNQPVRVYNFGRSGYHSNQEIILFQRLLSAGHVPQMVVFMDGLNDFCFTDTNPSGWTMLARHFNSVSSAAVRKSAAQGVVTEWEKIKSFLQTLPLSRLINAVISRAVEEPQPQYTKPTNAVEETPEAPAVLNTIVDRYLAFKLQVEGVSAAFGIQPVFVWQPIPTYKYDANYHLFYPDRLGCHVNSKHGYPIMAERVTRKGGMGANFVWAADMQEKLTEPLYIDAFHYTAPMSKRLANLIAEHMQEKSLSLPSADP